MRTLLLGLLALLVLPGTSMYGAASEQERRIESALAWLHEYYARQKDGVCDKQPCPLKNKWLLHSVSARSRNAIDIAFMAPAPAPAENIAKFKSAKDLARQLEEGFCPYGGLEVYTIAQPPIELWVHVHDPQQGLVASHRCSRRVAY